MGKSTLLIRYGLLGAMHTSNRIIDIIVGLQKENGGVIMVNFYDEFVVCPPNNKPTAVLADVAGILHSFILSSN